MADSVSRALILVRTEVVMLGLFGGRLPLPLTTCGPNLPVACTCMASREHTLPTLPSAPVHSECLHTCHVHIRLHTLPHVCPASRTHPIEGHMSTYMYSRADHSLCRHTHVHTTALIRGILLAPDRPDVRWTSRRNSTPATNLYVRRFLISLATLKRYWPRVASRYAYVPKRRATAACASRCGSCMHRRLAFHRVFGLPRWWISFGCRQSTALLRQAHV